MKGKVLLFLLLGTALVLALLPVSARAEQGADFIVTGSASGYTYGADGVLAFTGDGDYTVSMTPGAPGEVRVTRTDRILVRPGLSVHLTLDNVAIELGYEPDIRASALEMVGADVTLTLVGQSTLSSRYRTCILAPWGSTLTINGTGSIKALAGQLGTGGAGIGGGVLSDGTTVLPDGRRSSLDGGTVVINSGMVLAVGGYGAGIGGCGAPDDIFHGGIGGAVTITGGTVTAGGGWGGAGIGGGPVGGDGGTVMITGGTVFAEGSANPGGSMTYTGAGIGGSGSAIIDIGYDGEIHFDGGDGGSVTVSGGTVEAIGGLFSAGIGGGISGQGGVVIISGGTINAAGTFDGDAIGKGVYGGYSGRLVNGAGDDVYLTEVTINNGGAPAASASVSAVITDAGYAYGTTDTYTDADGKLYLYLPAGTATSAVKLLPVPRKFEGTVITVPVGAAGTFTYDETAPAAAAIAPAGILAPLNGGVAVTFSEEMQTDSGAVSLTLDGETWTPLSAGTWSAGNTVYTAPYSGFPEQTYYTVKAEGFKDFNGNAMSADSSHTFRTLPTAYAVTYTLGGGTNGAGNPETYTIDDAFTLVDPARAGYTFAGWSGTDIAGDHDMTVAVPSGSMGARSYTAHWTVNAYTLTLDAQNGSAGTALPVTYDAPVGALPAPTRTGHVFKGWNTRADGFGTLYTAATVYQTAGNLTLYAVWVNPSAAPDYQAGVKTGGGDTTLPITVDNKTGTASIVANTQIPTPGGTVITVPSIPNVSTYTAGLPVVSLSAAAERGTLTFNTALGSVTVPANMLTGVAGTNGNMVQISVGRGSKDGLPENMKAVIGDRPIVSLSLHIDGKQTNWSNPDAPVTVTIPYSPTAAELANPESIIVWYIDGDGKLSCIPNGKHDPVTGTVTFTTTHFSLFSVGYNDVSFNDVESGAWYHSAVSFIAAREITSGTGGGNYSPDAKLTRGEFIVMLMKAYGISPDTNLNNNFTDAGNTYCTSYLATAKRLGITAGVGNNMYAPGKEITRQEMFGLLYNALKVVGQLPERDAEGGISYEKTLADFTDRGDIAAWATEAMTLFVETGTVSGHGDKLNPTGTTTRAEMAQVLFNLLGKQR